MAGNFREYMAAIMYIPEKAVLFDCPSRYMETNHSKQVF